ncbi:uncharacterized protein H6S33_011627 [Morchella sextelata]|uniref:uncharacterized protein n=1 Tax=Morchella sextelata TaxID=1174677 RepID=UPI001D057469|nr:uncharacterized protein H6S33_011627 [Morchella sextelata]KAH0611200.1 hypothetical protein H6S33_011627 [Morchella sextelata]
MISNNRHGVVFHPHLWRRKVSSSCWLAKPSDSSCLKATQPQWCHVLLFYLPSGTCSSSSRINPSPSSFIRLATSSITRPRSHAISNTTQPTIKPAPDVNSGDQSLRKEGKVERVSPSALKASICIHYIHV